MKRKKGRWPATHLAEIDADAFGDPLSDTRQLWGDERDLMNDPPRYTERGQRIHRLGALGRVDALRLEGNKLYDCPTGKLLKRLDASTLAELERDGSVEWIWPRIRLFPVRTEW